MSEKIKRTTPEEILLQFERAGSQKPTYSEMYPFLEALFLIQLRAKESLHLPEPGGSGDLVQAKWAEGFPILLRWDFPIDIVAAEAVLRHIRDIVPASNRSLTSSCGVLEKILDLPADAKPAAWESFLRHDREPWMGPGEIAGIDVASLLVLLG